MKLWTLVAAGFLLASQPASNNFQLNSYGFGSGGTANSSSSNYRVNGIAGEQAGSASSAHYGVKAGETHVKEANVPTIAITNDDNWYNKLKVVIGAQNNPSDAKFAVAISTDNFVTTQYVKSDLTISPTLAFADYQTYASWGSATGVLIRGLSRSTVYTVKAKAWRGKFTESGWGPTSNATTVDPQLAFDIDVSATDTNTNPPFQIDFGTLLASTVTNSPTKVWVDLDTNGESGGKVYLSGQNAGLKSLAGAHTIAALSGDLSAQPEGFGAQGSSATQGSGGPFTLTAPYNVSGTNVGVADATIREIFGAPGPVVAGRGSFLLKAKTQPLTPASGDYTELLTAIASASF
ncbi:MAG: hypothetical protein JWN01_61 [Patescibacteria group bacterium]|nr:hypothetical protein [Patescibacteria group bacterium]